MFQNNETAATYTKQRRVLGFNSFLILFFIYFLFLIEFLVSPWNFAFIKSGYTYVITFFIVLRNLHGFWLIITANTWSQKKKLFYPPQAYLEISNKISQV